MFNFVFAQVSIAKRVVDLSLESIVKYGFQVVGGIVVLFIGWVISKFVVSLVANFLDKKNVDVTVKKFLIGAGRLSIMALAALLALGKFGIELTPLVAGLSVAGVGVSLALQGTLSNYAAGASLIFAKPFKVGDIIEVAGVMGEVEDISLPRTQIGTVDGAKVMIPNKHIIGEIIQNFSDLKKVSVKVGISYNSDLNKVTEIIRNIAKRHPKVYQGKEPSIGISEFADSSITISTALWCKQADYWDVLFDVNKAIFEEFNRNTIVMPFPQRDVHLHSSS